MDGRKKGYVWMCAFECLCYILTVLEHKRRHTMPELCQVAHVGEQVDWITGCCFRVHALGWSVYDFEMEQWLLMLLVSSLEKGSAVAATKHAAILNKLFVHAIASSSASV